MISSSNNDANNNDSSTLTFLVKTRNDRFSSFKQKDVRHGPGVVFLPESDTRFCTAICLVRELGMRTFMKVDIEGLDDVFVRSLAKINDVENRTKYVLVDNVTKRKLDILVAP